MQARICATRSKFWGCSNKGEKIKVWILSWNKLLICKSPSWIRFIKEKFFFYFCRKKIKFFSLINLIQGIILYNKMSFLAKYSKVDFLTFIRWGPKLWSSCANSWLHFSKNLNYFWITYTHPHLYTKSFFLKK